jgi:CheY-like chemotaxis protein
MLQSKINKGNILIVDDTPQNLTVLRQMLTEYGYLVRLAISGELALEAIQSSLTDLILLDII